jgi:MFS family permease
VLTVIYVFSIIDRMILNLLVGPIRRDLGISDTQMSLLIGFSFAVFYTFFGIPLGRLADTKSRRTIIAASVAVWSVMTAACGLAGSFIHFLLLRMGVGVGEAGLSPSAYSLISDYFPKEKRATAISVYTMAIFIGTGIASFLGGLVVKFASSQDVWHLPLIGATRSWQVIFFIVGLPGLALALLMYTVAEPARKGVRASKAGVGESKVRVGEVAAYIRKNWITLLCHNVGFALLTFSGIGSGTWIPTFFIRKYGWTAAQAGLVYGSILIVCGPLGLVAAGRLSDWLAKRGRRDSNMRVGLFVTLAWIPTGILYTLAPTAGVAVALLIPTSIISTAPYGVAHAALIDVMPNAMRGQVMAIYLFLGNLIGLGLGPTAVALTTDYIFRDDNAINYSLLVIGVTAHIGAAVLLWLGLSPYIRSLDFFREWIGGEKGGGA